MTTLFKKTGSYLTYTILSSLFLAAPASAAEQKPWNFVFILADDLGYGDLGCFGATKIKTPVLDSLAKEGMRCTSFYTQPVCGPSRAALLTGCYPMRLKQYDRKNFVRHPFVHLDEVLIPEVLKEKDYVSAGFGKWDLNREFIFKNKDVTPIKHGFDYFYGQSVKGGGGDIYSNGTRLPAQPKPAEYDQVFTDEAIGFIEKNRENPFFVYLAYRTPHAMAPLAASKEFLGSSEFGLYGDSVQEMDYHIGRLLEKIKEWKLEERTVVVFTSDNGPWHLHIGHPENNKKWAGPMRAGSPGPLRGQKTETWEGGVRTPFLIKAPGLIQPGTESDEMIRIVDILPTFADIAGTKLTQPWKIDGKSLLPLLSGKTDESPVDIHYYYFETHLQAVRDSRFKLVLPRPFSPPWLQGGPINLGGQSVDITTIELYDLKSDIGEQSNVAAQYPEVVKRLLKEVERARADIGDYNRKGENCRTDTHWAGPRAKWLSKD